MVSALRIASPVSRVIFEYFFDFIMLFFLGFFRQNHNANIHFYSTDLFIDSFHFVYIQLVLFSCWHLPKSRKVKCSHRFKPYLVMTFLTLNALKRGTSDIHMSKMYDSN